MRLAFAYLTVVCGHFENSCHVQEYSSLCRSKTLEKGRGTKDLAEGGFYGGHDFFSFIHSGKLKLVNEGYPKSNLRL